MERPDLLEPYVRSIWPKFRSNQVGCCRSPFKLEKLVQSIGVDVEVILADADDIEGLNDMTARSKVAFNCWSFAIIGSNLVAACVKNASLCRYHWKNFWVKGLIEKHHENASKKGVRIIPSCGLTLHLI